VEYEFLLINETTPFLFFNPKIIIYEIIYILLSYFVVNETVQITNIIRFDSLPSELGSVDALSISSVRGFFIEKRILSLQFSASREKNTHFNEYF
jgi:hypothetical protein